MREFFLSLLHDFHRNLGVVLAPGKGSRVKSVVERIVQSGTFEAGIWNVHGEKNKYKKVDAAFLLNEGVVPAPDMGRAVDRVLGTGCGGK